VLDVVGDRLQYTCSFVSVKATMLVRYCMPVSVPTMVCVVPHLPSVNRIDRGFHSKFMCAALPGAVPSA
jgi:hypothetical protein